MRGGGIGVDWKFHLRIGRAVRYTIAIDSIKARSLSARFSYFDHLERSEYYS